MLPRAIASFAAFENAMSLDIAMGGSTNTVLHLLAAAHEAGVDFTMEDIDRLSRRCPCLCKVAAGQADVHMEDVHRAGGIMAILGELDRAGLLDDRRCRPCTPDAGRCARRWDVGRTRDNKVHEFYPPPRAGCRRRPPSARPALGRRSIYDRETGVIRSRARVQPGRRAGGAQGQPRARRLHREDRRRRRFDPAVLRPGAGVRVPGSGRRPDPRRGKVEAGDVVVIRYEGPKGGPGMQEMLYPDELL